MRNLFYFASVCLFLMTSCSNDDISASTEPVSTPTPVLVTKIIKIINGGAEKISEYFYDGTKITQVTHNDGRHEEYFYNNNRISSMQYYVNGIFDKEDYFEYNSAGTLLSIKTITVDGWEWGERYTYDSFGVNIEYYMIEPGMQEEMLLSVGTSISIKNKNITSTLTGDSSQRYYFDDKNDPFTNISGLDILTLSYALRRVGVNNVVSYTQSYGPSSATTYTYNTDDFPITSLEVSEDGQEVSKQYFYNQ